jgi:hypothetical protein
MGLECRAARRQHMEIGARRLSTAVTTDGKPQGSKDYAEENEMREDQVCRDDLLEARNQVVQAIRRIAVVGERLMQDDISEWIVEEATLRQIRNAAADLYGIRDQFSEIVDEVELGIEYIVGAGTARGRRWQ